MSQESEKQRLKREFLEEIKGDGVWTKTPTAKNLKMDTNKAQPVDWDDAYFMKEFVESSKYNRRPIPSEAAIYAKSFLNWYVYNITPSAIQDNMIGLISSVKHAENSYLISNDLFVTTSVSTLTAPGDISEATDQQWTSTCQGSVAPQSATGANLTGISRSGDSGPKSITLEDANNWYKTLWTLLSAPSSNNLYPATFHNAIYYLGFIAMQLLRVCVKDKCVVAMHIMTYTKERYTKFFGVDLGIKDTIPPHDNMLDDFKINFDRFKIPSIRCLTMIVYSHITISGDEKDLVQSIFRAIGLLSLSSVGLGCLGWLYRAHEATNIEIDVLLNYVAVERHAQMVRSILTFIHTTGGNVNERSWQWCRLFTDGAFADLSTLRDTTFAAIFMEVATNATKDDPLWDIPQFHGKMKGVLKDYAYQWGQEIIRDINVSTEKEAKTEEAKRVINRMSKYAESLQNAKGTEDQSLVEVDTSEDED